MHAYLFCLFIYLFIYSSYLMGCSNNDDNAPAELENGEGLLTNHAYGLLKVKMSKHRKM
jgi:hypothetical protein